MFFVFFVAYSSLSSLDRGLIGLRSVVDRVNYDRLMIGFRSGVDRLPREFLCLSD